MSLYRYFQREKSILPSRDGPLSSKVPSSHIEAANKRVSEVLSAAAEPSKPGRGVYKKYTPKDKATVANYSLLNGTSAAIRHFKDELPDIKCTSVNDWKRAVEQKKKIDRAHGRCEPVVELSGKKRGRPSVLSDELTNELKSYVYALRDAGGVINSAIVIAAATGILQKKDPSSLECSGGSISLKKSWAKYF